MPQSPQQSQPGFRQFESSFKCFLCSLILFDQRKLFGLGRNLRRRSRTTPRAVANFKLRLNGLQLLAGDLLLETRNLRKRFQLAQASRQLCNLKIVLALRLFRLDRCA